MFKLAFAFALTCLLFIVVACGGQTDAPCPTHDAYTPVSTAGDASDWTMTLDQGTRSPSGCQWAGEVTWSNGTTTRSSSSALEFDWQGRIIDAPQDLCPDGPCGDNWSAWELWEPAH